MTNSIRLKRLISEICHNYDQQIGAFQNEAAKLTQTQLQLFDKRRERIVRLTSELYREIDLPGESPKP